MRLSAKFPRKPPRLPRRQCLICHEPFQPFGENHTICHVDCSLDGAIPARQNSQPGTRGTIIKIGLLCSIVCLILGGSVLLSAQDGDPSDMSDPSDFGDMNTADSPMSAEVTGECCMDMTDIDFPGSQDGYAPGTGPAGHNVGSEYSTSGEGE